MGDRRNLTLSISAELIRKARECDIPINRLVEKTLQNAVKGMETEPLQAIENVENEAQDKRDIRKEEKRRRAERFWRGVYHRRWEVQKVRYEAIGRIIKEKERARGIDHDEELLGSSSGVLDACPELSFEDPDDADVPEGTVIDEYE